MKIAISGKGGVGKSTLAAALALLFSQKGHRILALDADPDSNLAAALGMPLLLQKKIIPISKQIELIEERTSAKIKQYGQIFKINPEVSDIAEKYAITQNGVSLLVLGAVERGGSGCACPESILIRSLVIDLVLHKNQTLIMDMEAGVEHLGRATASGVDVMLVVLEPGQRSIDSTERIITYAKDIGIQKIKLVANKVASKNDEELLLQAFPKQDFLSFIPYSEELRQNDRKEVSVLSGLGEKMRNVFLDLCSKVMEECPG